MTDDEREDLDRLADEMEWDGMPQSADWLRRIIDPGMMEEWRATQVRRCFAWGTVTGTLLTLAVVLWWQVLVG